MARLIRVEDLRAGVLMKPVPFTVGAGDAAFDVELRPLNGSQRLAIFGIPADTPQRGLLMRRAAVAAAMEITEDEAHAKLPVQDLDAIAAEVFIRSGFTVVDEPEKKETEKTSDPPTDSRPS